MKAEAAGGELHIGVPFLAENGGDGAADDGGRHSTPGSTSFFKTCFNGLNALSGVGILSVPYALSCGGWSSLLLLFFIAGCTFYTSLLIQRCMDLDTNITTYPDIGHRAFGPKGRALVAVAMNVELYLVATGFLILEGDNLHTLFPDFAFEIGGVSVGGRGGFIFIIGLIVLPTVWLDNMSFLSYISATGVLSSFILIASILWAAVFDGIGFRDKGTTVFNGGGIPTAVSLYAFCYCAHPVFPTLYTSMRDQKKFSKVMAVCFLVGTFSYASMAVLGYLMFGDGVQSQVTLNLPINRLSSKVAIYTTLVNPLAKYALMVTPIVRALEKRFVMLHPTMIRSGLVVSTIVVALAVPFFADLMSLVGAFLSVTASVILPCVCYMKIAGRFGGELVWLCGIVFVGCGVVVVGTYTALLQIFDHLIPS